MEIYKFFKKIRNNRFGLTWILIQLEASLMQSKSKLVLKKPL